MSNPVTPQSDSISANQHLLKLTEILKIMQRFWRLILGVVLFSVFVSLVVTLILPKKFEASATLQIAKLPSLTTGELTSIENLLQSVERVKLIGFKEQVLKNLQLPTNTGQDRRSDILIDSLSARPIKNTEFITVTVSAYSEQDAIKSMGIAIAELQATHAAMTLPTKNRLTKELKTVNENLSIAEHDLADLTRQMANAGVYSARSEFSPSIVAINLLEAKEATKRVLQLQQAQLNNRVSLIDELSTKPINSIISSDKPISPKRSVFLVLGALLGLLSGIGIALWKHKK